MSAPNSIHAVHQEHVEGSGFGRNRFYEFQPIWVREKGPFVSWKSEPHRILCSPIYNSFPARIFLPHPIPNFELCHVMPPSCFTTILCCSFLCRTISFAFSLPQIRPPGRYKVWSRSEEHT